MDVEQCDKEDCESATGIGERPGCTAVHDTVVVANHDRHAVVPEIWEDKAMVA